MKVIQENTPRTDANFFLKKLGPSYLVRILALPFILWVLYLYQYFDIVAFVHLQIFYGIVVVKRYSRDNYFIQISSFILVLILGSLLLGHKIQGFDNYPLINALVSKDAIPYSLWLNKDSIILGLSLIIVFYKYRPFERTDLLRMFYVAIFGIFILISLAFFIGIIKFDFKYFQFFWVWLVLNVLYVFVEEAFFRLFLLESVIRLYGGKYNIILAVLFVSIIFAVKHQIYGNFSYSLLSFVASVVYSCAYILCGRRLEASVFCHLAVNITHIIFFTYPFLKG
ncbi:MAG: CPBP family intramembrane metalloprotease [Rickettsiales bacterium]|nr:CPBP family intramembrane metalloprotease [Rickettsiales bacterium]